MTDSESRNVGARILQAIFDGALDAMLLADDRGCYIEVNPAACALFGLSRAELLGRNVGEFAAGDFDVPQAWQTFIQHGRMRGIFPLRRLDGTCCELDFSAVANVLPGMHLSILREITESERATRKLAEELRASEARYRRIIETTSEGVWLIDAEDKTTFVNERMAQMLGYAREEMLGQSAQAFMDDEARSVSAAKLERRRRGIAEVHEHRYRKKDGSVLWTLASSNPIFDDRGRYEGALGMFADITERKHAQDTQRRLAAIVESSDDAIMSRGMDGLIRTWNHGAEKLFQYTAEEAIGQPISMLYPPESEGPLQQMRARVEAGDVVNERFWQGVRKDGSRLHLSFKASVITDSEGKMSGVSVIARDVSEQIKTEASLRRTEEQLRQSQKMEAVGSLAGGVAHDFSSVLDASRAGKPR